MKMKEEIKDYFYNMVQSHKVLSSCPYLHYCIYAYIGTKKGFQGERKKDMSSTRPLLGRI
ncbi:hypothetical protein VCRA2122O269_150117 [Vibrio crassostreae]|nr:hypothetical protein VCRA2113O218_130117 [Vibrio crassostreae]CAK3256798.1 hypothetical protein VCRA2122O269_150117 [Vibrio crassostreae]